jgi:hypothetical protein
MSVESVVARHYRDPNSWQAYVDEEEGGERAQKEDSEHCRSGADGAATRNLQNCGEMEVGGEGGGMGNAGRNRTLDFVGECATNNI